MATRYALRLLALIAALAVGAFGVSGIASAEPAGASSGRGSSAKVSSARELSPLACRPAARRARLTIRQRRRLTRTARNCRRSATKPSGEPQAPLYWGASIGKQLTGTQAPWDMNAVSKFEDLAGKQLSLVNFFAPFAACSGSQCSFYKFAKGPMENIRLHGAIPVFSWSSQSIPSSLDEPDFQLSDVLQGRYDAYIREFAEDARDWGHPFFLRFNWEMNGNWFPWSEGVNGNQQGEFVAAWRHVHDVFTSVGATNANWVWCPNIDPAGKLQNLDALYPGDEYVDWTGLDGYNWGPSKGGWASFDHLYKATYDRITASLAPSKPLLIGEMGSSEQGGSKAAWISEALTAIPSEFPMVRGMLWFNTFDDGMDWPIETSSSATAAFAEGIQNPSYQPNSYADLGNGPIAPPS
jgi:Glycosyl hydrolase family 26